jgi:hypothetical protein
MAGETWSLSTLSDSFKIKYGKLADKVYNAGNPVTMQVSTKNDFVGKQMIDDNPLGFSGSVGSRIMPKSNVGNYANSVLTSKKIYATVVVDRESMKASSTSEGAFFKFMDKPVKDAMDSFDRNRSRMFYNDGSGILAYGAAGATAATDVLSTNLASATATYTIPFVAANFNEANFEEKDFVQVVTGITNLVTGSGGSAEGGDTETNLLEVVEVDAAGLKIKVTGTSALLQGFAQAGNTTPGTGELPANAAIVMQRSYEGDLTGLRLISKASVAFDAGTTGLSLYGIPLQRRWRMFVKNASGALTKSLINQVAIGVEKRCGKAVTMLVPSYEQFAKMLDLSEDQKRYTTVMPSAKGFQKAIFGFEAVEYLTTTGPVPVIPDRFVKPDEIWFLNKNYIEYRLRPEGAKWADEDGTVFLRTGNDSYEATYAAYGECFISPPFQGHLTGLTV